MTGPPLSAERARFRAEYGAHRAAEGRTTSREELLALPYLGSGPLARQWQVRARSFDTFLGRVLGPLAAEAGRPLQLLDLGAGNGWLCYRVALAGHRAVALDLRSDGIDGLGAAGPFLEAVPTGVRRVVASFDALPLDRAGFDLGVFNAALHYALDLAAVLHEACRVIRPRGRLVILDSPFYTRAADGEAMVAEKHRAAPERFGARADVLMALPFVEYLTRQRLELASAGLGLAWHRHRVRYPLWYEARPLMSWLRGHRRPSRFDVWETRTP